MGDGRHGGWRWVDVPVPEPHVAGLLVGGALHVLVPVRATMNQRVSRAVGVASIGVGLLLIGWAVRTVGSPDARHPSGLVTTGPYAFTRNPMYVGWSALYLGLASVLNAAWLFVVFPAVAATCHRVVRGEERALERAFGDEYRAYRRDVRRYL